LGCERKLQRQLQQLKASGGRRRYVNQELERCGVEAVDGSGSRARQARRCRAAAADAARSADGEDDSGAAERRLKAGGAAARAGVVEGREAQGITRARKLGI
jgi:fructose-1,6-bisphosphatase/inositol monophosphatase family enzyme